MKWVKLPILTLKQCLFSSNIPLELLINTAPPLQTASTTRISRENALKTDNSLAMMWLSSLWDDFACRWTGFNCPPRHFFLSFFPLFGRFVFTFLTISFTYWHVFLNSCVLLTLYGFARCCDKRISSLTLKRTDSLRVERLQRGINKNFAPTPYKAITQETKV